MKPFKFFQKEKKLLTIDSHINLRDIHNRQKVQWIRWSEYPTDSTHLVFRGNILEFYDHMLFQRDENGNRLYPIIYEIGMFRSGYFNQGYTISNRQRMIPFISRKWRLKIHYNI